MTQGLMKRAGIQDAGSILSQIQTMKMLEVQFSCGFLANNAMQACQLGSKRHKQQPFDVWAQVLNMYDRRNGTGKLFVKLAQLNTNRNSMSLPWCAPCITGDVLQQIVSDASNPAQNHAANV